MIDNITVLTDDLGLNREYREEKRKANVGERIKIVDTDAIISRGKYENGEIFTVDDEVDGYMCVSEVKTDNYVNEHGIIYDSEYVVIVPTDIIRIDGVRYREELRKAKEGEKIAVVAFSNVNHIYHDVRNGEIFTVEYTDRYGCVSRVFERKINCVIANVEYRVLIPVTPVITPKSTEQTPDVLDLIAELSRKVVAQDKRIQALEESLKPKASESKPKSFVGVKRELTRDDVIERAKADIEALKVDGNYHVKEQMNTLVCNAEFIVNNEKRTAVALLRGISSNTVFAKGIAKCAPDDVFNSHIGRAIALYRALGAEVPEYLVKAPKPTEVNVGDIVRYSDGRVAKVVDENADVDIPKETYLSTARESKTRKILDDSRES